VRFYKSKSIFTVDRILLSLPPHQPEVTFSSLIASKEILKVLSGMLHEGLIKSYTYMKTIQEHYWHRERSLEEQEL
jgi:hypothetical protein